MPSIKIGADEFECRDTLPKWQLLDLASSMRSPDLMRQAAGLHDFVMAVVKPEERERFVETMQSLDDDESADPDTLNHAVGDLMVQYAAPEEGAASARPTGRSSASPSSRKRTGGTSRVASSSPDTAHRVLKLSRPTGRSAAS